ncbi:hypothetical protein JQ625_03445 [Bradyrhizobium diazoefficiens]|nr:hypothetical protein [Bradyrhizobium diazoefficiens]MBR0773876.1 hypothetical protein [Bradyrhizobium diazoefficiens]
MSNMWGRSGAPMIQPTKDELRGWLREARADATEQRRLRKHAEYKLGLATRALGSLVLEGKIEIPLEKLGQIVLEMRQDEEIEADRLETQKLLANS